ncbi:hypothetical protein ACFX2C_009116 [Malus domestica]
MIKWAIALGKFDISYQPKQAEKSQAMVDFITDFTYLVDIVSTPKEVGCEAGLVLMTSDKVAMEYALRFKFKASNNEAEYEALLAGLRLAKHLRVTNDAKNSFMAANLAQTQLLLKHFHYQITQIPRAINSHADALARLASPPRWKIRLGEKFKSNCWQHQAPWLRKCATYNKEIVGLPRFIDSLLMAPFQMTKSKLSRFDTRLPVT